MATETPTAAALAPGTIARQELGAQQLTAIAETSAASVAAQAQAAVQARYVMALQRPRDWDDVRARILREIERPGFAESAWFRKPIGDGVEGLSVRFTDMAGRCMGNLLEEAPVIYEDATKRIVRVSVTDLEANVTKYKDAAFSKTVERRSLTDGRVALSVRTNSYGKPVYTVPATEDELLGKEGALVAKIRRNLILQLLPGDVLDQARARIIAIRQGEVAKDPDAARRKILDSFATLNVPPSELRAFIGHDLATCSPAEITKLRDTYSAIVSGEHTWSEFYRPEPAESPTPASTKTGVEGLKEKLKSEAKGAEGSVKE